MKERRWCTRAKARGVNQGERGVGSWRGRRGRAEGQEGRVEPWAKGVENGKGSVQWAGEREVGYGYRRVKWVVGKAAKESG